MTKLTPCNNQHTDLKKAEIKTVLDAPINIYEKQIKKLYSGDPKLFMAKFKE